MRTQRGEAGGKGFIPAAVLAVLVPVGVAVGIYFFGTHHTPNYDTGLFGEHGTVAVDLKAQLSTALLGLASSSSASLLDVRPRARCPLRTSTGSAGAPGARVPHLPFLAADRVPLSYDLWHPDDIPAGCDPFLGRVRPLRSVRGQDHHRAEQASARLAPSGNGRLARTRCGPSLVHRSTLALNGDSVPGFSSV